MIHKYYFFVCRLSQEKKAIHTGKGRWRCHSESISIVSIGNLLQLRINTYPPM